MRWHKAPLQQKLVWVLATYCFAVLAVYGWKPVFTNASEPVRGITDPVIALQMVRNIDEVDAVLGDSPSADREVMRIKQYLDFAFIPGYTALGILLGVRMSGRRRAGGYAMAGLMLLAAGANLRENLVVLQIVNSTLSDTTAALLQNLHSASVAKWGLLGVASLLLGSLSLAHAGGLPRPTQVGVAGISLLGGALTLAGLFENRLLPWGGIALIAGLLLSAAILNLSSAKFATQHESVN